MADSIVTDLQLKYQPLVGVEFEGTYQGEVEMPQTKNPRDIISIKQGTPFALTLQGISQAVTQAYGEEIWKGITGPVGGNSNTEYRLWAEPGLSQVLAVGSYCKFRIEKCTPFQATAGPQFTYGVSIKVSPVIQPPQPVLTGTFQTGTGMKFI